MVWKIMRTGQIICGIIQTFIWGIIPGTLTSLYMNIMGWKGQKKMTGVLQSRELAIGNKTNKILIEKFQLF